MSTPIESRDERRRSRALVIAVNAAKLLALSVLVPPVAVGLAQRASELAPGGAAASVVASTATLGSLCAVLGALLLGRLADLRGASQRFRWGVAAAGAAAGLAGTAVMVAASEVWQLLLGWGTAQLGLSGAMAVLRALLGVALPHHRQRGATVMVLVSYLGAVVPLLALVIFPGAVWGSALALAGLALAVPLGVLLSSGRREAETSQQDPDPEPAAHPVSAAAPAPSPVSSRGAAPASARGDLPWPLVLAVHFAAGVVLSAYLSYHALDIAQRESGAWGHATVQLSVLALAVAVLGLLGSTSLLLVRPALLARTRDLMSGAGLLLAVSIGLRPFAEPVPLLLALILLSGAAVGINSSAIFAAALAQTPAHRLGRRLGLYSALAPAGQLVGPLAGLAVVQLSPPDTGFRNLFLAIATVPLLWAVAVRWWRPAGRG